MKNERTARNRALVIGGSMAGLLAARTLAEHFAEVVILERDALPTAPDHRRGTPQTRHAHGLLASGLRVLEELFPGIIEELVDNGGSTCDPTNGGLWVFEGAPMKKGPSGTVGMIASRPFLEHTIRTRVFGLPNVRVEQQCSVRGLEHEGDRVTGVQTSEGILRGDLVVDASGRGSQAQRWLDEMGFETAGEDSVKVDITYTTRLFKRSADHLAGDGFVVISPQVGNHNSGVMIAQEGGIWMATLVGSFGHRVPEDLEGFIGSAKELQSRHIYDVVRNAEPIGEAIAMRYPASVRRRYEKLKRFPRGFLTFGDSICSFNPLYGQGMSVAATEAKALGETLADGDDRLAQRFFKKAAKIVDVAWDIAVGNDLKMPETPGHRSLKVRFVNWYVSKVHRCAHDDADATVAFIRVAQLLDPPETLMRPSMVLKVIAGAISRLQRRIQTGPSVHQKHKPAQSAEARASARA